MVILESLRDNEALGEVYGADAERSHVLGRGFGRPPLPRQAGGGLKGAPGNPQPAFGQAGFARRLAEVDHVYVLVEALYGVVDVLDHYGVWRYDLIRIREPKFRARVEDIHSESSFLQDLTFDSLNGVFVGFDVAAGREPRLHLRMPVKRDAPAMDYESGGGEVSDDLDFHN